MYGGQVALALDQDLNCLDSFKNMSNVSQTGLSLISSDPSRVCLCTTTGIPNCTILSDSISKPIFPGQAVILTAVVVVGQDFGTVTGPVYAQYLKRSPEKILLQLQYSQKIQSVTHYGCTKMNYNVFSPSNISEAHFDCTRNSSVQSKYPNVYQPNRIVVDEILSFINN